LSGWVTWTSRPSIESSSVASFPAKTDYTEGLGSEDKFGRCHLCCAVSPSELETSGDA